MSRPSSVSAPTSTSSAATCAGLVGLLLTGVLSGCSARTPQLPTAPPAGSSTTTAAKADYPIAIQRVGGIAGFTDTVTLQGDKTVLATVQKNQVTCTLDAAAFSALSNAALTVGDSGAGSTPTMDHPDDMLVLLNGVPTSDERLEDVEPVVTTLLEDLAKPAADRTTCR